jgi:tetratricopeptide (TPR) repeat protein
VDAMKDIKIDEELKKKLIDDTEIPEMIEMRIEETLQQLDKKRNQNSIIKKGFIVAAVLIVCITISGFYIPEVAQALEKIPLIGHIIGSYGKDLGMQTVVENQLYEEVNQEIESEGIVLRVKEVMYDGIRLIIGYEIETEKKFMNGGYTGISLYADGKELDGSMSEEAYQKVDENKYVSMITVNNPQFLITSEYPDGIRREDSFKGKIIHDSPKAVLPDTFIVTVYSEYINDVHGKWRIDVPVEKLNVESNKKNVLIHPNIKKVYNGRTLEIKEIKISEVTTSIKYDEIVQQGSYPLDISIYDDQGKKLLDDISGSGWSNNDTRHWECICEPIQPEEKYLIMRVAPDIGIEDGDVIMIPVDNTNEPYDVKQYETVLKKTKETEAKELRLYQNHELYHELYIDDFGETTELREIGLQADQCYKLGQYEKVLEYLNEVEDKGPDFYQKYYLYIHRGMVYEKLNDIEESIKWYDKAIDLNQGGQGAYKEKARSLGRLGKIEEAIKALEAYQSVGELEDVYYMKIDFFEELGEYNKALELCDKWIQIDRWGNASSKKAEILLNQDNMKK